MKQSDRKAYIERYSRRLQKFGYAPETLGWGKSGRQEVRFFVLTEPILQYPQSSVLDVGCGFADLYDYLIHCGWSGRYTGIDIVPDLVEAALARHPGLDIQEADIASYAQNKRNEFDFVVASGVFNAKLQAENNLDHIARSLRQMFELAEVAVCADFMSTFVDFQDPSAWHTDPAWTIEVSQQLSGRFQLRYDYMPFEFALIIYKDNKRSSRNVFHAMEAIIDTSERLNLSFAGDKQENAS